MWAPMMTTVNFDSRKMVSQAQGEFTEHTSSLLHAWTT